MKKILTYVALGLALTLGACDMPVKGKVQGKEVAIVGGFPYHRLKIQGEWIDVPEAVYNACGVDASYPECGK